MKCNIPRVSKVQWMQKIFRRAHPSIAWALFCCTLHAPLAGSLVHGKTTGSCATLKPFFFVKLYIILSCLMSLVVLTSHTMHAYISLFYTSLRIAITATTPVRSAFIVYSEKREYTLSLIATSCPAVCNRPGIIDIVQTFSPSPSYVYVPSS